jgi:5'-phosphate synthase pdxT subunit
MLRVGILALQGGVIEHVHATRSAARKLKLETEVEVREVRTKKDLTELGGIDAFVIPGGESTTLQKLLEREALFDDLKSVPAIFGTCAGAILLAKKITDAAPGQKTLRLMDFEAQRNAYGPQNESFEETIATPLAPSGKINAVFIRAPRITRLGSGVTVLAELNGDCVACEQKTKTKYLLATTFHPELSTTLFHERFLKNARLYSRVE